MKVNFATVKGEFVIFTVDSVSYLTFMIAKFIGAEVSEISIEAGVAVYRGNEYVGSIYS